MDGKVMIEDKKTKINVSDFQKVAAVTAVMMQTILTFALANTHNTKIAAFIGFFYTLVKYTAPMFIFAIVYNMVKTSKSITYWEFLKEKFFELTVPYLLWTTMYLVVFQAVQQKEPYIGTASFLLKYLTGNGAPHLWYTVMMLQIQLLMPFFVWLGYKVFVKKQNVWPILIGSTALYVGWYLFYGSQVINGAHAENWYLLDRFVLSFVIYGIYGVAGFVYHKEIFNVLNKVRFLFLPAILVIGGMAAKALLGHEGPVSFANAPYLNTIQSLYSLVIVMTVFTFATRMILNESRSLPLFKWLSLYAYRTYLANVFVFQVLLLIFKDTWLQLPSGIMILIAYLSTAICAFATSWIIHTIWTNIKKKFCT